MNNGLVSYLRLFVMYLSSYLKHPEAYMIKRFPTTNKSRKGLQQNGPEPQTKPENPDSNHLEDLSTHISIICQYMQRLG